MDNGFDDSYQNLGNMSCNAFLDLILSLSEYELSILGCAIGLLLCPMMDANQQSSLGNFFELIGQVMLTVSSQAINLQPSGPSKKELMERIRKLEQEINNIKRNI